MYEAIIASLIMTLVVVPLAVLSMAWTVTLGLRRFGVNDAETRAAVERVIANPMATAVLGGCSVIGICLLLGQVYS